MARIELKGHGSPIPTVALPDPSVSGDLPPLSIVLPPGDFEKADYVGLGYTHFEAVCIGAAGGRGGDFLAGTGFDGASRYFGGGGGGGGLHRFAGTLASLPDLTPVVVGQVGTDGVDNPGDTKYLLAEATGLPHEPFPGQHLAIVDTGARPLTRGGITFINGDGSYVFPWTKVDVLGNPRPSTYNQSGWDPSGNIPVLAYVVRPNANFTPSQDGQDGGYSSFGDVCKASGGKAGKRAPMFSVGVNVGVIDERHYDYYNIPEHGGYLSDAYRADGHPGGNGGEGGIGGSIVAGGGGAAGFPIMNFIDLGSSGAGGYQGFTPTPPVDGTWDGEIGKGGGGGHGGGYLPANHNSGGAIIRNAVTAVAQNSAQGSFNYGDTSMFGPRQNRSADPASGKSIVPGTGGGAKPSGLQVYGGRSPGAIPDGVVWVRLTKIV